MSATLTPARGRRVLAGLAAAAVLSGVVAVVPLVDTSAGTASAASSPAEAPVLSAGATWRYLQDDTFPSAGSADPLDWTKAGFADSAWKSGSGTFGGKISGGTQSAQYDSSRTADVQLEMNGATGDRVRTYFFRTTFELTEAQLRDVAALQGSVSLDDGAVVYVNGHEVARQDVDPGMEGLSYANVGGTGLETLPVTVPARHLTVGTNVVAVEVHNDRASSSDIWFQMSDLLPASAEDLRARPTRVILTPTDDPYTSQNITFQGAEAADTLGRVEIRPTSGGDLKSVRAVLQPKSVSNDFGHFSATVTGLKPGTRYTYRVSSNGKWSAWADFETANPNEKEFQYVYYGDAQVGLDSTWPSVVAQAEAKAPSSIGSVHAGDLIDVASTDSQWKNWFAGMEKSASTTNVMAAPGNHEYSGDKMMTAWKAHFEYPLNNPNDSTIGELARLAQGDSPAAAQHRAYFDHWADFAQETVYYTDYQGVRFITVNATRDSTFLRPDSVPAYSGEGAVTNVGDLWTRYQAAWLDHVLTSSESKWNVVTFHQPVYSTSAGRNEPVLRQHWVPVFQKHNIDLVQMGHDHTYARGFNNEDVTETPGVTDGPVYMVSNSGAKHYDLETDAKNVWTLNGATQTQKAQDISTYQVVDVAEDTLTVRSYIAEIVGTPQLHRNGVLLDASQYEVGDLWDEFTVHKTDDGRKLVTEAGMPAPQFEDLTPAPEVTTDLPAQTAVTQGERVTLTAEVAGAETLQWQRKVVGGEWADVPGAKTASLALGRVHLDELGTAYRLVATAGTKSSTTVETVLVDGTAAPVIDTDLSPETFVVPGAKVTLEVEAAGAQTFQWQSKDVAGEWTDVEGARGRRLALGRVTADDLGVAYRVLVGAGTVQVISGATLLVDATRTPVFAADLPGHVRVTSGSALRLAVALEADTPAQLQWQRKLGGRWVDMVGRTGPVLALDAVRAGAEYRVVATAGARTATSRAVTVQVQRKASTVKVSKVVARQGRVVTVKVKASTAGVATVKVVSGKTVMRRTVTLRSGRPTTVKLSRLSKKAKGRAAVSVTFEASGPDHRDARTMKKVRVKK